MHFMCIPCVITYLLYFSLFFFLVIIIFTAFSSFIFLTSHSISLLLYYPSKTLYYSSTWCFPCQHEDWSCYLGLSTYTFIFIATFSLLFCFLYSLHIHNWLLLLCPCSTVLNCSLMLCTYSLLYCVPLAILSDSLIIWVLCSSIFEVSFQCSSCRCLLLSLHTSILHL
jgi:hypothetical protein